MTLDSESEKLALIARFPAHVFLFFFSGSGQTPGFLTDLVATLLALNLMRGKTRLEQSAHHTKVLVMNQTGERQLKRVSVLAGHEPAGPVESHN